MRNNGSGNGRQTGEVHSDNAVRALVRSFGLLRRVMEPFFNGHGISGSQWGVLRALRRAEDAGERDLRLTDLGARLLVRPPSVTGSVKRLQRMGLIECTASPSDQRAKHVRLTAAGRALMRRAQRGHKERVSVVLGGLEETDQRRLLDLLDRLSAHMESIADGAWAPRRFTRRPRNAEDDQ